MTQMKRIGPRWSPWLAFLALLMAFLAADAWANGVCSSTPVKVWVQPSGDNIANAYALQNEPRTYFGRAEGGTSGTWEYKWDFSDGTSTAFSPVGNPNYINYDNKAFATFGTQWALLTVRDPANTCDSASAQINLNVIAAGSDDQNRQKNSAIDRGLRWEYQTKNDNGASANWEGSIASTGLALIAFENQGHNLQSPDSDLYKKSVQQGVQWLLDNAVSVQMTNQRCIGNPETAPSGDTMVDGIGVVFGGNNWDSGYYAGIAVLAIANSADKAFAQSYIASTGSPVNGLSLYQIGIQAKDYLAWSQGDGSGGGGTSASCNEPIGGGPMTVYYGGLGVTDVQGYMSVNDLAAIGGCGGTFLIDWGDGTAPTPYVDNQMWCPYYGPNQGYPEMSYYNAGPTHSYAAGGNYTVSFSYTGTDAASGNPIVTPLCSVVVNATGAHLCGYVDATQGAGGWRYTANYGDSDNSATQWDILALTELKNRWGIQVNPEVVYMNDQWLDYSACNYGPVGSGKGYGFGYTSPDNWCNYQKSAAGLIMMHYTGRTLGDDMMVNDLAFLGNRWDTSGGDNNFGNHYGMYAMYKAMKIWNMPTIHDSTNTARNWESEYDNDLINRQQGDGSWYDNGGWFNQSQASSTALAILAPAVASLPPVANPGGPYGPISPNTLQTLDGSASYHKDPSKHIVKYEWDFDSTDGMWWATKPAPGAGEGGTGVTTTVAYPDVGHDQTYTVTLRVTDDSTPPLQDVKTTTVSVHSGEVAPIAKTNGPWTALPNTMITFDGSASFDPNDPAHCSGGSCVLNGGVPDHIVSYEWDLNGDGIYNNADGSDGTCVAGTNCAKVQKSFPNPVSLPARLRVCDSFGQCNVSSDALNVVSIALVYGQNYQTCYHKPIDRFTDEIGMAVVFKNQGNTEAEHVVMTLTSVPTNMTILNGTANLGNMNPGQSVTTACNPTAQTADIRLRWNKKIQPTGNWTWQATFDLLGTHYTVFNIPPMGP